MTTAQEYLERRWTALILLCVAQFIVVLDASIVNVALPSIGRALNFSEGNLAWVVNAYVIAFGGFLLLGGRAADLLGRRRVFMAGLIVVGVASLAAGFAATQGQLIAARAAQGLGAAIVSPSALSIVTSMFGLAVLSTIATTRTETCWQPDTRRSPTRSRRDSRAPFWAGQ